MSKIKISNALISVSNKSGIVDFCKELQFLGVKIFSTGGTFNILSSNGVDCVEVQKYTGFPEILNGRVKTLHPKIFGGILASRELQAHQEELDKFNIEKFDLVVVNLYPFEEILLKEKTTIEELIENIDIGGVALIRAAAKNYKDVLVVVDKKDYEEVLKRIKEHNIDIDFRINCAKKAFLCTAKYDSIIANWFNENANENSQNLAENFVLNIEKINDLRYGENPHQKAAVYRHPKYRKNQSFLVDAQKIQGKELSYNNYLDLDSAVSIVQNFNEPACAIIKHNNPCGVAISDSILDAYINALNCDPSSAFGGIIALNKVVDESIAVEITKIFTECVIAPDFTEEAKKIFSLKKDLRLLVLPKISNDGFLSFREISGGYLVQTRDSITGLENIKTVTRNSVTEQELSSLKFAFIVCKYVKSNAILLVKKTQTLGIGAGQMSRIDALKIAAMKMQEVGKEILEKLSNYPLVLASDAFFPFRDVVDVAAKIGVRAIIQPGGSIRDEDSIKACDEHGISMVFTGVRHFRH